MTQHDVRLDLPPLMQRHLDEGCYRGVIRGVDREGKDHHFECELPFKWVTRDILIVKNLFSEVDLPVVLEKAEASDKWENATTIGVGNIDSYYNPEQRNNDVLDIHEALETTLLEMYALCASNACAYIYMSGNVHGQPQCDTGYQLLRYKPGQYFNEHIDQIKGNALLGNRSLTLVVFLNEVEVGGELRFPRDPCQGCGETARTALSHTEHAVNTCGQCGGAGGLFISPEPGTGIVFPSGITHPHQSMEVQRGVKFALVTWYM